MIREPLIFRPCIAVKVIAHHIRGRDLNRLDSGIFFFTIIQIIDIRVDTHKADPLALFLVSHKF